MEEESKFNYFGSVITYGQIGDVENRMVGQIANVFRHRQMLPGTKTRELDCYGISKSPILQAMLHKRV